MVLRLDMPGLDEFPYCKKAFEELEQIAAQDQPDKARVHSLVKYLQDNKLGTEWVMLEDEKRFSFLQHKVDYILRDEIAKVGEEKTKLQAKEKQVAAVEYNGLEFELHAPRAGNNKTLLTYDANLDRIKAAGMDRNPTPAEAFSLIAGSLEGKLQEHLQKAVADDMLDSYGEWLSMAVERKGDILVCYLHPEGLVWDGNKYIQNGFLAFDGKQEINIAGIKSEKWVGLSKFSSEFVKLMYGREFNGLPQKIKDKAEVYLPPEGNVWPVGRSNFNDWFNVNSYYYNNRASRGVSRRGEQPQAASSEKYKLLIITSPDKPIGGF